MRTEWLRELCVLAGVVDDVLGARAVEPRDREQRVALLHALAKRGHSGARDALYAECGRDERYATLYACSEIADLDGETGILFVARTLGARLAAASDGFWVDGAEFADFDARRGEGSARRILEREATTDPRVRAYLEGIERARIARENHEVKRTPSRQAVELVLASIRSSAEGEARHGLVFWGSRATAEESRLVLEELLASSAPRALESALRCLAGSLAPPLDVRLFELTEHDDVDVRFWAARVLAKHALPAVRSRGLAAFDRGDARVGLELLRRSAAAGDAERILSALVSECVARADADERHSACTAALEILETCPEVREPRIARWVYEHSPCMDCRERAIEELARSQACPAWLVEECASDGSESIRGLASTLAGSAAPPSPGDR